MVGTMDATTFIYSKGERIYRSTHTGGTWTQVSPANPQTRIPVLLQGVNYLGGTNGLLVSKDKGANWRAQGRPVKHLARTVLRTRRKGNAHCWQTRRVFDERRRRHLEKSPT